MTRHTKYELWVDGEKMYTLVETPENVWDARSVVRGRFSEALWHAARTVEVRERVEIEA